uniref:WW domain binding protein VOPP1 n=1 Tax=Timema bartmani TaxID=61472 RepID=A0A7R9FAM5_9NEOP|nr:unnamed protein product [Timema bartmani]
MTHPRVFYRLVLMESRPFPSEETDSLLPFLVLFLVLSCIGGYSLWRRWHPALSRCWCFCCCCRSSGDLGDEDPNSEQESTRSCCPPPHYSRCSSFRHAPPPYTEVTSKPDLYPLVISYGDSGKTGPGSSYLMVQYFRNYIVRPVGLGQVWEFLHDGRIWDERRSLPILTSSSVCAFAQIEVSYSAPSLDHCAFNFPPPSTIPLREVSGSNPPGVGHIGKGNFDVAIDLEGSLSATSTADSLSSSFLCSAANEANSVIPPPYSCSLDELQATPGQPPFLSIPHSQPSLPSRSPSCEMPLSASLPRHNLNQSYVSGTAMSTTGSDVSSLAGVGTPGSPPRATSPTQEIRELLDKIQQLPLEETPHDLSGDCGVPTGVIVKSKWHREVEKSCGALQHCDDLLVLRLGCAWCKQMKPCTPATILSLLTRLCLDQSMASV